MINFRSSKFWGEGLQARYLMYPHIKKSVPSGLVNLFQIYWIPNLKQPSKYVVALDFVENKFHFPSVGAKK